MKILLFGKNGQVGNELQRSLAPLGELVALDRSGLGNLCGDLTQLNALAATVRTVRPDVIVNAAAYTAVDKAESEPELAQLINAKAVGVMAQEAKALGAWLVHYSTDYVFDGSSARPYTERDTPNPQSVYGHSKLAGEQAIVFAGCDYSIFRTSWVYGVQGNNFAKTVIKLAFKCDSLRVVADQKGAPTGAALIADVTAHCLVKVRNGNAVAGDQLSGIYNLVARGFTTRHAYARYVIAAARSVGANLKLREQDVQSIETAQHPTLARRPGFSGLDVSKIEGNFGLRLPSWELGIAGFVEQILADNRRD
jgi:dTDP-4-dehydrorhamnose reductase